MNYLKDIRLLELTNHINDSGQLSSIDFMNDLNSDIKRSFIVISTKATINIKTILKKTMIINVLQ